MSGGRYVHVTLRLMKFDMYSRRTAPSNWKALVRVQIEPGLLHVPREVYNRKQIGRG